MENIIVIQKNYLALRSDASILKKKIQQINFNHIELDFSAVIFISRSFADELLNIVNESAVNGKKIKLTHLNSDIKKLLYIVKKRKQKIRKSLK